MTAAVWFLTGASRGLGRVLAETVREHGDRVVATARDVRSLDGLPGDVIKLPLDVTNPDQVRATVAEAIDRAGAIDVLVNNAGYGLVGA